MEKKLFNKIRSLFKSLDREIYDNAQGDDGQDMRNREGRYMKRLDKLLHPTPRFSKDVRAALAETMLPDSFLSTIEEDGKKLADSLMTSKDIEKRIKEARKWMYVDDQPGIRGESQMTVATYTYALTLRKNRKAR